MSKKRKLLQKLLRGSKNVRFDELLALALGFGFTLDRASGSHHCWRWSSNTA
ncbi:MAG: type II toxin-antitoxin system HicA family toxin [Thermaceae bacterium]|nr:type II toxin-antitoxin system HicA family toxin [Thermaceae bacterium]